MYTTEEKENKISQNDYPQIGYDTIFYSQIFFPLSLSINIASFSSVSMFMCSYNRDSPLFSLSFSLLDEFLESNLCKQRFAYEKKNVQPMMMIIINNILQKKKRHQSFN